MDKSDREFYAEYFRMNPFWTARGFSHYNPTKIKETYKDCNPSICDKDLMSDEN